MSRPFLPLFVTAALAFVTIAYLLGRREAELELERREVPIDETP